MGSKFLIAATIAILGAVNANGQGMAVNTTGTAADASALLDVNSTTQGMLVPRMDSTHRVGIASPATGLLLYQTNGVTPGFYYYAASGWQSLSTPATTNASNLTSGTVAAARMPAFTGDVTTIAGTTATTIAANATAGNDIVTAIGSATTGTLPTARLGTGTPSSANFLRGNGTWAVVPGTTTGAFTTTIEFENPGLEVANTTYYFSPANSYDTSNGNIRLASHTAIVPSDNTPNFIIIPTACTAVALKLGVNNYSIPTSTVNTVTLYVNGNATTMTTNVTTNGTRAGNADVTHTVSLAAGDMVSIGWSDTNNAGYNGMTVQLICQ